MYDVTVISTSIPSGFTLGKGSLLHAHTSPSVLSGLKTSSPGNAVSKAHTADLPAHAEQKKGQPIDKTHQFSDFISTAVKYVRSMLTGL